MFLNSDKQNAQSPAHSAPCESPPPSPRITLETTLDIRRNIEETRAIVSEVRRDVNEMQHMLEGREGNGSKNWAVSGVRVLWNYWMDSDNCTDSN